MEREGNKRADELANQAMDHKNHKNSWNTNKLENMIFKTLINEEKQTKYKS